MKVYVAGASSEIERVEFWVKRLREQGIEVTSTWTENVRKVGYGNPADADHDKRGLWAKQDLAEVKSADVLWYLLPSAGKSTSGAWVELGCAYEAGKMIVLSGQSASIFTGLALVEPYTTDGDALDAILEISGLSK